MNKTNNIELSRCDEYDCKIYPCDECLEREFDEERPGTLIGDAISFILTFIMSCIGVSIVFGIGIMYFDIRIWNIGGIGWFVL
jgi:hypothetical protein